MKTKFLPIALALVLGFGVTSCTIEINDGMENGTATTPGTTESVLNGSGTLSGIISKDLLINEVLRKRKEVFLQDLSTIIQKQQSTKEQLFSFFYYYHDWFKHEDFQGCMFTHSLSELGRKSTAVVEINQDIKRDLKQILLTILSPLVKGERAHRIAYVFIILIDGCITAELTWRDQNEYSPALVAWSTAKTILESEGIMI